MKTFYPIFLSVVVVVRNQSERLQSILAYAASCIEPLVSDYEIVVVDNASDDDSLSRLKAMAGV